MGNVIFLTEIQVIGFKSSKSKIEVKLPNPNVCVVYGENGCGKTTFLKILHAVLAQNDTVLLEERVESIDIKYTVDGSPKKVQIFRDKSENEKKYEWKQFQSSPLSQSTSVFIGIDRDIQGLQNVESISIDILDFVRHAARRLQISRSQISELSFEIERFIGAYRRSATMRSRSRGNTNWSEMHLNLQKLYFDEIPELLLKNYGRARWEIAQKIQGALYETLLDIDEDTESNHSSEDMEKFKRTILSKKELIVAAIKHGEDNAFKTKILSKIRNISEENLHELSHTKVLFSAIYNMIKAFNSEDSKLNSIRELIDNFNARLLGNKKVRINDDDELEVVFSNGETIPINRLSSGERHLLTLITTCTLIGRERNFLVIDEPEISLNVIWQRELLPFLEKQLPNTQIIVATHSPSILGTYEGSEIKAENNG